MKKLLVIILVIGVVAGAGFAAVFYATSAAVETADSFFKSVAQGDMDTASTYLAEGFTSETTEEELLQFLESSGLTDYKEADWGGRSVDTSSGKLIGKVITNSGRTIPLTLTFVREEGDWKIYYIQRESAGLASTPSAAALPDRAESAEIVQATTADFARAVNAKDLSEFHGNSSTEFQEQVSLETFNEGFSSFLNSDIDLTVLQNHQPMFTVEPAISADGVLQLQGYYDTRPSRATFEYKYVYRKDGWELLGIGFNITPVED
ncbi:MAG TPA: hypothetical protein VJ984_15530 [Xanthomonadales bacterium]|nr:hypothetical protein [Xanthomonadales bacterium]